MVHNAASIIYGNWTHRKVERWKEDFQRSSVSGDMDLLSAWIVSHSALPFLCLIWGTQAQQAFRTEPRNLTVRMGATAVLRCEVLRASGTVQWVKDGLLLGPQRSLPGFPRYSMIGNPKRGQYHLQIEKVQLEDDATFECQAGQSESSHAIISSTAWVNVLIPPSSLYFEVDMSTPWVAGKTYTVTCVAPDAKPVAEITLYKDGVKLTGAESFIMSGSKDKLLNTHAEVTVTAVSSDNGRQLACHAKNSALFRPLETTLTMSVYFPPPRPPVIVGLEREEVKAGRMLVLHCVSEGGNPLATLHWTKNGEVLSKTWEEDAVEQKSSSILYLMITPADNQAELCCEIEPAEVILSGSSTAIAGQELMLSCFATSSNPPVQIRWWLGYKELNNTVVTMEEGDHGGMTTMSNMTHQASREDDGLELTCEAFNKGTHFSKTQMIKLSIYYPPQKVWLEAPPQDVPLNAGTKVRLICFSTGGNPIGTLTWFKNGRPVTNAPRQTSFDRGVARELVIVLAASDNMATYSCDAKNEAKKTISANTKLMVYFTAISMRIISKQEELRLGQTLTLECQAGSSNPKVNISWSLGLLRFQGVEQPPEKAKYGGVSVRSSLSLVLSSQHHNQKVICQAHSPVIAEGTNTFFKLNVLYPPEFSPHQPTQVQVVEDDMATIPLLVSANPEEVSCIWLHRKEEVVKELVPPLPFPIPISSPYGFRPKLSLTVLPGEGEVEMGEEAQEDESGLLTIHDVTRAHAGLYQCTANNGIAPPASTDVQLIVQCHPDPPSLFRQVSVTDDSVTLEWIPGFNGGLRQRFRIRYRWDQSISYLYVDVFPPRATMFTVTGLQPVTTYNFSVNALNAMGESDYADNNAVLTITTKERPEPEEIPADEDSVSQSKRGLPAYLTIALTVVFGLLLLLNSLGCFFGLRWKRRQGQTGGRGGTVLGGKENEEKGHSTVSTSNKYESREKINTAAQRTLLIESASETDSNVYESYAAESSHHYYPTAEYLPPLSPHSEEIRWPDITHRPVDSHSHLYEDVRDGGLYQDIQASSLPSPLTLVNHRLPCQWRNSRPPPSIQNAGKERDFADVRQPRRDSDLPFELRGELV
ncbi:hypothetical protein INR49_024211 [Caranx melampygus]|nr:hypothetical protein INR49_024211 [Caranx melampygus]